MPHACEAVWALFPSGAHLSEQWTNLGKVLSRVKYNLTSLHNRTAFLGIKDAINLKGGQRGRSGDNCNRTTVFKNDLKNKRQPPIKFTHYNVVEKYWKKNAWDSIVQSVSAQGEDRLEDIMKWPDAYVFTQTHQEWGRSTHRCYR